MPTEALGSCPNFKNAQSLAICRAKTPERMRRRMRPPRRTRPPRRMQLPRRMRPPRRMQLPRRMRLLRRMLHPRRKGRKTRRRFDLCRSHILQLFFGRSEVSPLQLFSVPQDGEKEDAESRTTQKFSSCFIATALFSGGPSCRTYTRRSREGKERQVEEGASV